MNGRRCLLTTALLLTPGSCGYALGFAPLDGVHTVAVEVVDNHSFRQRLERDLTRSIARSLNQYSPYRHARKSHADAVLRVEIVGIRNSTLVIGSPPVAEGSLDAIARIRLERRSGEILVDTQTRDIAEFRSTLGENETSARAELVSDLGRVIVLALEGGI